MLSVAADVFTLHPLITHMNSRSVAIFAVVVAIIVGATLWFLNSEHAPHYSPATPGGATPAPAAPKNNNPDPNPPAPPNTRPVVQPAPDAKPPAAAAVVMTDDDRKIDDILSRFPGNTDADNTNTAQALINILPTLTADGQSEAAQHIVNLLDDKEIGRLMPIWKNPGTNQDVIDVIGTDMMNRENSVMLPAMLEALKNPKHPFHDDAQSTLEIFLDEDYGDNIPKWEAAMKKFLKEEAAEEGNQ